MQQNKGDKLAKLIAKAGLCSRRDAEKLIKDGRVKVGGKVVLTPATRVVSLAEIEVDNKFLPDPDKTRLWLYYKPVGLITTHKDPQGRATVFSNLPKTLGRVVSVGRLDVNSEGLLLLTNDGAFARYLELPQTKIVRVYKVQVYGNIENLDLEKLKKGFSIQGVYYQGMNIKILNTKNYRSWLIIELVEGKNREIRKVLSHFGFNILKLIRLQYGPYKLDSLQSGEFIEKSLSKDILFQQYNSKK